MKKKRSFITAQLVTRIVSIFVCVILVLNLVAPDRENSNSENRPLQGFPAISLKNIVSGDFTKELDTWFSDQFVGRDSLIHLKYVVQKMTGVKKIQDVFLTDNGLMEDISEVNSEQYARNIAAINNFCQNHSARCGVLIAPTAANVLSSSLPKYAQTIDQNQQIDDLYSQLGETIQKIDVRNVLSEQKDQYLYYKSDHHWTSLGAYYAFTELASAFELGEVSLSDYDVYPVVYDFEGTLAKKVGSLMIKDEVDIYVSKNNPDYVVMNDSTGTKSRSIYNQSSIDSSNPYEVFLSGNSSLIQIESLNDSQRHLLLIKDSYANSMIQFLLPYYRTITIVDPRYYYDDLERLYNTNLITDVLFLYNANTFVQDTSLADVLE